MPADSEARSRKEPPMAGGVTAIELEKELPKRLEARIRRLWVTAVSRLSTVVEVVLKGKVRSGCQKPLTKRSMVKLSSSVELSRHVRKMRWVETSAARFFGAGGGLVLKLTGAASWAERSPATGPLTAWIL
jgi:hypothetical protein